MKLSVWAKNNGISYRTAHRWFKSGEMPCRTEQMPSGTIIVYENEKTNLKSTTVIYCRVSSYDRKESLNGQIERCLLFANKNGLTVDKVYKEIASGMNDKRPKLLKLLDSKPNNIIVEHKDRLTRFGFNYLETLLNQRGCNIFVLNRDKEDETDLIKDLISIITSFCCRLYGLRRGHNKIKKIKETLDA